jgi:hypothetical protein
MEPQLSVEHAPRDTRLETLLARCEADRTLHMNAGGCPETELQRIEAAVGQPLPLPFRVFLSRLGGGVYYLKHEVFGPRRVMVHDIELVPDLLSFRHWLGEIVPRTALPIHRADGVIHVLELAGDHAGSVRSLDEGGHRYPDFTSFLEAEILGRR